MKNYNILGDFLAIHGRLPQTKKEYAIFALFQGGKNELYKNQQTDKH